MNSLVVETTEQGLSVSWEQLREFGIKEGQRIEIAPLPDAQAVRSRALSYILNKLGEGLGVGEANWDGSEWEVEVLAPGGKSAMGFLYLDHHASVKAGKSLTYSAIVEAARATGAGNKAAA